MSKPRNIRAGARLTLGQAARLARESHTEEAAFAAGAERAAEREAVAQVRVTRAATRAAAKVIRRAQPAESTRATYLQHLSDGMTQAEIAKLYGVSRQSVHQLTTGYEAKRLQNKKQDAERRAGAREYACGVCGELGHNAQSHQNGDVP